MTTKIRTLDGLPIEEPTLDAEGQAKQKALSDIVVAEYEKTGKLISPAVRERIEEYEAEIGKHVVD